jgi:mycofactocin system glycosyltransferase
MKPVLPVGYTVELNRHTRMHDGGRTLIGGAPTRVLFLTPAAIGMMQGERLTVSSPATRALANRLIDAGMAEPVLSELPSADDVAVTVVVPVRDRPRALRRLLASIGGRWPVIVVDDASIDPRAVASVAREFGAKLVALEHNVGPAGARNAGLAAALTEFVAFVDSDVVVGPGTIETLARHFADPSVAVVAPRVVGLPEARRTWIGRYEEARSSLDLGLHPATVRPKAPVSWVSSTFLIARVDAIADGFSADMRVGEDVDFVWRVTKSGWRVRYEPAATVAHEHRTNVVPWLSRKAFYGTGAHPLAERHPTDIAPAVLAPWSAVMLLALLAQRRWSLPVAAGATVVTAARIATKLGSSEHPVRNAAWLTGNGVVASLVQGMALLLRHWWPATAVLSLFSKRVRRAVAAAAVVDVVIERERVGSDLDFVRFGLARRLDDIAYGAGVWWSALRARSVTALLPHIARSTGKKG